MDGIWKNGLFLIVWIQAMAVSYTHLRAHETVLDLVCRLLLEKKKKKNTKKKKQTESNKTIKIKIHDKPTQDLRVTQLNTNNEHIMTS